MLTLRVLSVSTRRCLSNSILRRQPIIKSASRRSSLLYNFSPQTMEVALSPTTSVHFDFHHHFSTKAAKQLKVSYGSTADLPEAVLQYVKDNVEICRPDKVHICDGSEYENETLISLLRKDGILTKLKSMENCYLARTDPADVARVEKRTFICTEDSREAVPKPKDGIEGQLGNWKHPSEMDKECERLFPGCMTGRTMYVIPFSMGPVGSPLSKIGIQLTDSAYVVSSMRIMTRIGADVLDVLRAAGDAPNSFVRCLHSVGQPLKLGERQEYGKWPCDPKNTVIAHYPSQYEIRSFGSGYGGNSLLGKKCFALRLGSTIARDEGWLAEHMLILGVTNPQGVKRYVAAAFPSACGKTNLAMMCPNLPGWKVECVGDDIAWMRFDKKTGRLRAINPEAGFFGVAPGTSDETNPHAMSTIKRNTLYTNVAETADGRVWWEGLPPATSAITDWKGKAWQPGAGHKAAHPNSRFCAPASQCPVIDEAWEHPDGVPIDAIIFGGRRPEGVPLVYEAYDWAHGVFVGAAMRSEVTAAASDVSSGPQVRNDPFAMKPFFGYNFGRYLEHWLSMEQSGRHMPKVYHVNWFRKEAGKFLWPGFGDNIRVIDWICRRLADNGSDYVDTPIGRVPTHDSLDLSGLKEKVDMEKLLSVPRDYWMKEVEAIGKYFDAQLPEDTPEGISSQLDKLRQRLN